MAASTNPKPFEFPVIITASEQDWLAPCLIGVRAAKNAVEFRQAIEGIAPAIPMEDKLALRALRKEYRLKYRKPVQPGEGAAPGPIVTAAEALEVG